MRLATGLGQVVGLGSLGFAVRQVLGLDVGADEQAIANGLGQILGALPLGADVAALFLAGRAFDPGRGADQFASRVGLVDAGLLLGVLRQLR
ncbi:hypothetical protein D9M70_508410 [compost metagenome]